MCSRTYLACLFYFGGVQMTWKVQIHSEILHEMFRAEARLHRVSISEIVAGGIAVYTARVLHVWYTLVLFEWFDWKLRIRIPGAILCKMLRVIDKLRRVFTPKIFAGDIVHNIARISHVWFTLVAFKWLHWKLRTRIHGAILCAMLRAMAKLRRVSISEIVARDIGRYIARILHVLSTWIAFE